jgi:hypothetical protein
MDETGIEEYRQVEKKRLSERQRMKATETERRKEKMKKKIKRE